MHQPATACPTLFTPYADADEYPCSCSAHTPLDTLETSGFGLQDLGRAFRHSGWRHQREKIYQAFFETRQPISRINNFADCGRTCFLLASKTNPADVRLAANSCHDRFCLPCAQARSRTVAANVAEYLPAGQTRFVTLTLRHDGQPLGARIDRLYESFKKLRKHPLWRRTQKGGVAFLEIKRSRDRQSWHPHFHVLTQGNYIDGAKLATLWRSITTDSFIVDVRMVTDQHAAIQYVTKYASKPFDPTLFESPATLQEAILALKSRKMTLTFGNWKGLQTSQKPTDDAWENLGTIEEVFRKALAGSAEHLKYIRLACRDRADLLLKLAPKLLSLDIQPRPDPPPQTQIFLIDPYELGPKIY